MKWGEEIIWLMEEAEKDRFYFYFHIPELE